MVEFCLGFYFVRNNDIWWYFVDGFLDYRRKGCTIHVAGNETVLLRSLL
jgi:hypothetical protein